MGQVGLPLPVSARRVSRHTLQDEPVPRVVFPEALDWTSQTLKGFARLASCVHAMDGMVRRVQRPKLICDCPGPHRRFLDRGTPGVVY